MVLDNLRKHQKAALMEQNKKRAEQEAADKRKQERLKQKEEEMRLKQSEPKIKELTDEEADRLKNDLENVSFLNEFLYNLSKSFMTGIISKLVKIYSLRHTSLEYFLETVSNSNQN